MKNRKQKMQRGLEYVPGAADDGLGFFPGITCQIAGKGAPRVLWIVYRRRQQLPSKEAAVTAADAEIALAFGDPSLPSSPGRFLGHLRQRGFESLTNYRVAKSYDDDRRTVLGDEFQLPFGEEAARHDPVVHAALMEMVNRQIVENDPPETRETFERLLAEGYSPEHARRLIGALLIFELTRIMVERTPFDRETFVENLRRLPEVTLP